MARKTNPRRQPATQADVDRAYTRGLEFGTEFAINCVLFVLKDKHDAPNEDIMRFRDEFMYLMDSVGKRYVSYPDIKRALSEEYKLYVTFTDGGKEYGS